MARTPTSMLVRKARLTLAFRISRSPTCAGATKSEWSMLAVTTMAREWRTAATAPTRSIHCIRRPPKRLPMALVSAGKMISLRSACDWATVRETTLGSLIHPF